MARPIFLALALSLTLAQAQTGPRTHDPNALPQGPDAPRRADSQSAGLAAQAEARAECRRIEDRQQRRQCVREAREAIDRDRSASAPMPTRPAIQPQ